MKCLDAESLARAALSCSRFHFIVAHRLFWSARARGSGVANLGAFLAWCLVSDWLRRHARGSSDPLPGNFPASCEAFAPGALQLGDHVMILGDGSLDAVAQRSKHAVVESFDLMRGCLVVAMSTNGAPTYQRQPLWSLLRASGVDPDAPAGALRIQIIRSGSGHLSATEDIVERARAFLCIPTPPGPLHAIEGAWNQFAFGFFCQTGHLVSRDRFLVWYRDHRACI